MANTKKLAGAQPGYTPKPMGPMGQYTGPIGHSQKRTAALKAKLNMAKPKKGPGR